MVPYHPYTPLQFILSDTFYIKINHNELYAVLNFDEDSIIDLKNSSISDLSVKTTMNILGNTPVKSNILSGFVSRVINKVLKAKGKKITF